MNVKLGSYQIHSICLKNRLQSVHSPFSANYTLSAYLLVTEILFLWWLPLAPVLKDKRACWCWSVAFCDRKNSSEPGEFGSSYWGGRGDKFSPTPFNPWLWNTLVQVLSLGNLIFIENSIMGGDCAFTMQSLVIVHLENTEKPAWSSVLSWENAMR